MARSLLNRLQMRPGASDEIEGTQDFRGFMVISPFVGPAARERLEEAGISYADDTRNLRFTTDRPAVFIETVGAVRNPQREGMPPRSLRSLRGPRSARAVRALLDHQPPFGTWELAERTESSPSSISRVADLLEGDAIIERESPRGKIVSVDWKRLLRRWAVDYHFAAANRIIQCRAPEEPAKLLMSLQEAEFRYAVTGPFAAHYYTKEAEAGPAAQDTEPSQVVIYVADPDDAINRLGLTRVYEGGNVLIREPFDLVVFEGTEQREGITYARATQVAADLMTGPWRGTSEADPLMEWMEGNEERWRYPAEAASTKLFDGYVAVHWSAGVRPAHGANSIWIAFGDPRGVTYLENPATRREAMDHIERLLNEATAQGHRLLCGFAFPFGLPEGTARTLTGQDGWEAVWERIAYVIEDGEDNWNNRFDAAAQLNEAFEGEGPFWGNSLRRDIDGLPRRRPAGLGMNLPPRLRHTEQMVPHAHEVWQLNGAGSVGGQALTGIAALERLRRGRSNVQVWPFETLADDRHHILAEINPSLIDPGQGDEVLDMRQVKAVVRALRELDRTEQLTGHLRAPSRMPARVRREEGLILGIQDP